MRARNKEFISATVCGGGVGHTLTPRTRGEKRLLIITNFLVSPLVGVVTTGPRESLVLFYTVSQRPSGRFPVSI